LENKKLVIDIKYNFIIILNMPIKEYKCTGCKETFEALILSKSEEKNLICPKCGSKKLMLLFSAFSVAGAEKRVSSQATSCTSCSSQTCSTCK
jgi:putative FmdB family regulatory protein